MKLRWKDSVDDGKIVREMRLKVMVLEHLNIEKLVQYENVVLCKAADDDAGTII
jgi:hypothetical protein